MPYSFFRRCRTGFAIDLVLVTNVGVVYGTLSGVGVAVALPGKPPTL